MHRLATLQKDVAMQAVSQTMYVMFMQNITDMFGDIPYREAFMASQKNLTPVFDSQEEVYKQMCATLEQANKLYASNPYVNNSYAALDNMYGFNLKKWQRFNNSLYVRLLGRLIGRSSTVIDSVSNMTVKQKMQQIVDNPAQYPIFTSKITQPFDLQLLLPTTQNLIQPDIPKPISLIIATISPNKP